MLEIIRHYLCIFISSLNSFPIYFNFFGGRYVVSSLRSLIEMKSEIVT